MHLKYFLKLSKISRPSHSYEFDCTSSTWVNQEVAITQLEIENIEPAGIKMIKLIEPELDPLCIDRGILK